MKALFQTAWAIALLFSCSILSENGELPAPGVDLGIETQDAAASILGVSSELADKIGAQDPGVELVVNAARRINNSSEGYVRYYFSGDKVHRGDRVIGTFWVQITEWRNLLGAHGRKVYDVQTANEIVKTPGYDLLPETQEMAGVMLNAIGQLAQLDEVHADIRVHRATKLDLSDAENPEQKVHNFELHGRRQRYSERTPTYFQAVITRSITSLGFGTDSSYTVQIQDPILQKLVN